MEDKKPNVSTAFQTFLTEAPEQAEAWKQLMTSLGRANALEFKTRELAFLAMLAVLRIENGIPFHVQSAKKAGATREEVISAILLGLPLAGHGLTEVLPAAVAAYDAE